MNKSILIFIITYFASYRLEKVYKKIPFKKIFLKNFRVKVLISDDQSTDDTIKIAKKISYKNNNIILNFNKKRLGYGGNIKFCLKYAIKNNYDYAVMVHGDNQYNPNYINHMISVINYQKNIAAVCGSRMYYKKDALKGGMPKYKFIGNIVLTKIFNLFFNTKFTDCHSGFWFYNLSGIKKINLKKIENNFNFDNQLRINLIKKKLNILEIPIKTYYGSERSSVHLFYALRFLLDLFKGKLFKNYL
jgi:GT2 family glycosyltransferase